MDKVRGIVLRTVKYGDTGHIVDMFTRTHGRLSFAIRRSSFTAGHKSRGKSRTTPSLFLPLTLLEFECDIRGQYRLPTPKEVGIYHHHRTLQLHPIKSMLSIFIAEFLTQALKEETPNKILYDYIENSLAWLDNADCNFANFHIVLMSRLTRFLGIQPNIDPLLVPQLKLQLTQIHFDMQEGILRYGQPPHPYFLPPEESRFIPYLLRMDFANMHIFRFTHQQRQRILDKIIEYYRLHTPGFTELKSLEVLRDVFS